MQSISPSTGSSVGVTIARIGGTGFPSGATVTVDGSRAEATVLDAKTITVAMPAHAAGKVDVTVIGPLSEARASVPGGFTYVVKPPPVISQLLPNIGSTGGGTPLYIIGTDVWSAVNVTIDGIESTFEWVFGSDELYLSTPPHAAGTVEVVVTNPDGQTASTAFTYASPATFDFNGTWQGWALETTGGARWEVPFMLTIRDNIVVSVSCDSAASPTLDPPPVVANAEFSFAGNGGLSITGRIVSPTSATGSIHRASCGSRQWFVEKQQ